MYSGVPIHWPSSVKRVRSVSRCAVALATPKSMILGTGRPSSTATRMFDGLMSRWMMPFWWACCTPSQTCMKSFNRSPVLRRWTSLYSVSGTPLTYSMTKKGRPSSVDPASKALAMLGWFMRANACRSDSKRANTSFVSIPHLMSLKATLRRTGRSCSASHTSPMPPSPSLCRSRKLPIRSGGRLCSNGSVADWSNSRRASTSQRRSASPAHSSSRYSARRSTGSSHAARKISLALRWRSMLMAAPPPTV